MTTLLTAQVTAYADQVRAHLADLGVEVVDDLTDGLEADLAEELADRAAGPGVDGGADGEAVLDLARVFGSAAEYAAELRAAAGLAHPVPTTRRPVRDALRRIAVHWRSEAAGLLAAIRALPGGRWAVDTLVAVRPMWWVARGWVWSTAVLALGSHRQWWLNQPYLPESQGGWLLLAVLVLLSVSWGRGVPLRPRVLDLGLRIASVVAAVAVVPVAAAAVQFGVDAAALYAGGAGGPAPVEDGVVVDGARVSNMFVYDADGEPVPDAQIFDNLGRPVQVVPDTLIDPAVGWTVDEFESTTGGLGWYYAAARDAAGTHRWNVYPMHGVPSEEIWAQELDPWSLDDAGLSPRAPAAPFARATAVASAVAGGTVGGRDTPGGSAVASSDGLRPAD